MNIGFWNLDETIKNQRDSSDILTQFVNQEQLEILCLAEVNPETIQKFLKKINKFSNSKYKHIKCIKSKITVISIFDDNVFEDLSHLYPSSRWITHKIAIPSKITFNLVSVHFHSKMSWTEVSQTLECANLSNNITKIENSSKCYDTILLGDFNMNPFDAGIVAANGINAIPDLDYAFNNTKGREIDGTKYKFFYNPMWNFFGDFKGSLGTHYYRVPGHVSHEWNIFDQVIIRPSLKKYLAKDFVNIITNIAGDSLTSSFNRPDKKNYSDHLPIVFKLNL